MIIYFYNIWLIFLLSVIRFLFHFDKLRLYFLIIIYFIFEFISTNQLNFLARNYNLILSRTWHNHFYHFHILVMSDAHIMCFFHTHEFKLGMGFTTISVWFIIFNIIFSVLLRTPRPPCVPAHGGPTFNFQFGRYYYWWLMVILIDKI